MSLAGLKKVRGACTIDRVTGGGGKGSHGNSRKKAGGVSERFSGISNQGEREQENVLAAMRSWNDDGSTRQAGRSVGGAGKEADTGEPHNRELTRGRARDVCGVKGGTWSTKTQSLDR